VSALLVLSGCVSVDPRPAFDDAQGKVAARTGQESRWLRTSAEAEAVRGSIREVLKHELTADDAVQVALLNNRALQAAYEELGIAQADLAQAALVSNPSLSIDVGFPDHAAAPTTVGGSLIQDFLSVLVQPLRKKIGAAQLEQAKLRVGDAMLEHAARTKAAFYTLQARRQLVARLELILEIHRAAAEFARRQHEAGNIGDLDLANQEVVYEQTRADLALARAQVRSDREALNRLMGLWGPDTDWRVGDRLPEIPPLETPLEGLESLAIEQRLDVEAAGWGVDLVGRALALRKGTRYFPVGIHLGVWTEREPDPDHVRVTGPVLALQLPIFDTGKASIARLEAEHLRSQRLLEALAVDARSEVREARDLMIAARDLAEYHRDVLLPRRVQILDLTLRHYNMMLKGAYDLLLAKQNEVETERAYIDVWRDYWIARTELERAVGGRLPDAASGSAGKE
jgi:cobalt-zinc-cadmium efflux system outer membrane protein